MASARTAPGSGAGRLEQLLHPFEGECDASSGWSPR
jgi:hypothetical protein